LKTKLLCQLQRLIGSQTSSLREHTYKQFFSKLKKNTLARSTYDVDWIFENSFWILLGDRFDIDTAIRTAQ
jgi:hypothetical protein